VLDDRIFYFVGVAIIRELSEVLLTEIKAQSGQNFHENKKYFQNHLDDNLLLSILLHERML
jgi:hypothetical protein